MSRHRDPIIKAGLATDERVVARRLSTSSFDGSTPRKRGDLGFLVYCLVRPIIFFLFGVIHIDLDDWVLRGISGTESICAR